MPMIALQFLGSKLGAWAIVGILVLALGAAWKAQQWRIEARDGQIVGLNAQLDIAEGANERFRAALEQVTADLEQANQRADTASKQLIAARARSEVRIATIIKEANHAATPLDNAPAPPGLRAVLRGLRDAYPANSDNTRATPR